MRNGPYVFGSCTLDPAARELHRDGELVVLPPKVFDCLVHLITHRDRAVGRDELIAAVWGKVDVSDTLLGQTLLKARRAVGDTGNEQHAIRTVPRFGYRWVAPIAGDVDITEPVVPAVPYPDASRVAERHDPERSPAPDTSEGTRRRRVAWPAIAGFGTAALVAVIALVLFATMQRARGPSPPAATSVPAERRDAGVVLPVDVAAGAEWGWLRLGLMDLVASRLGAGGQRTVPADNVVALVKDLGEPLDARLAEVFEATGASFVATPVARRDGGTWHVAVAVRFADGRRLDVEAQATDAVDAARDAADRLLVGLGRRVPGAAADLPAGELLSRVEAALLGDDLDGARRLLESAPDDLRRSPEARLRLAQIDFRGGRLDEARTHLDALLAAHPAETEPVLHARILNGLGAVAIRRDVAADATRDFGRAITLVEDRDEPAVLGQAYTGRGIAYAVDGRFDLASADFARARIALELAGDTLALARVEANEAIIDARRGRHAEALAIFERAAERFERFGAMNERVGILASATQSQLALLHPVEALATSDRAWPSLGRLDNPLARRSLQIERARALAALGRLLEARALAGELLALPADAPHGAIVARAAALQARLDLEAGEVAAAVPLLRRAVDRLAVPDYQTDRARAWLDLARALRATRHDDDAAREVTALADWARTAPRAAAASALATAEQTWRDDAPITDREAFEQAIAIAEAHGDPADQAEALVAYGTRLIAIGELARAAPIVGQAARWADRDFGCALLQLRLYHALGRADAWEGALRTARALAGERVFPTALTEPPRPDRPLPATPMARSVTSRE